MTFRLVAQLSGHPNIVGIKDSTGNVIQLGEFANHVDADFNLPSSETEKSEIREILIEAELLDA
jgi:dihydrodipicolinate synthase/N-acetylneuraminate lyase